ncbi:MAG: biotin/lipoyl-binding protein [Balneolaceae bacterium]|nr:biotin/lipoyl-binding protein [Balneolaceae bacterium]MBO6547809.1 biotin/lipoyl-binding protein [Balneolaceae bacterium]MBO6648320.1 biotin/lipoyl-binding protein [Balneolaceae bacterium]
MKFEANLNDQSIDIEINEENSTFTSGDSSGSFKFSVENGRYFLRVGTKAYKIDNVSYDGSDITFSIDGSWHTVSVKDEQELLLDSLGFKTGADLAEGSLKAPMPGKILDILVSVGDEVTKGQPVAILEAMKMENELKSPIDGTVASIDVETGQSLEKNTPILEIEALG